MRTQRRRRSDVRLTTLFVVFLLFLSACSGSKTASDVAADRTPGPGGTASPEGDFELGDLDEPAGDDASGEGSSATAGGSSNRSSATVSAPGEAPKVQKDPETGAPIANLFKPEEDRVGFSASEIKLCMHAAFILGDVFNNEKEDEDVYWRMVNATDKVFGRTVKVQFEDDAYNPNQAVTAAEACKQNDAFFIMSGVGFDQIPQVREWAENNRQLYFHSMATEEGAQGKQFSFATAPSLQTVGKQIAQYFVAKHPGKTYAVLSRNSTNWDGALDAFKAELKRLGKSVAYEKKIDNGQDYNTEIRAMATACPEAKCTVFVNENVLNFAKLYQQAEVQGYRPGWFNYGFQLTTDTLGESAAASPAIEAWYPVPAFDVDNETNQPWWDEVKRMKDAYAKYCTSPCDKDPEDLNDVDWAFWLAWKSVHKMFLDCGKDCSRNRLVGMLLSGYKVKVDPLCETDFSRGTHHIGAWQANIYTAVPHSARGAAWKQTQTCRESF